MQNHHATRRLWRQSKLLLTAALLLSAFIPAYAQVQPASVPLTGEAADRVAIKELIDAYAHDADRRETEKQTALFTPDAILENIHNEPGRDKETTMLHGQKELAAGFATLKKFEVTMHFNGQSTIQIHGDTATGETYCLAHHIFTEKGQRLLMIIGIRYYDTIVRVNGNWLFARRQLNYDWIDRRPLNP
jgi:SnoaL-like domain